MVERNAKAKTKKKAKTISAWDANALVLLPVLSAWWKRSNSLQMQDAGAAACTYGMVLWSMMWRARKCDDWESEVLCADGAGMLVVLPSAPGRKRSGFARESSAARRYIHSGRLGALMRGHVLTGRARAAARARARWARRALLRSLSTLIALWQVA
jgi:hypothetical protein